MLNIVSGVQCADSVGRRQNVSLKNPKSGLSRLSSGDKCFFICWAVPSVKSLGSRHSIVEDLRMPFKSDFTTASPCRPWIAQEFVCHRAFQRTLETHQLRQNLFWIFLINFTLWKAFYSCLHVLSHGLRFPSCREDILRLCLFFFGETKAMQKVSFLSQRNLEQQKIERISRNVQGERRKS